VAPHTFGNVDNMAAWRREEENIPCRVTVKGRKLLLFIHPKETNGDGDGELTKNGA